MSAVTGSRRDGSLVGAQILVTRPAHQAHALCQLIKDRGGLALRLPLFTVIAAATAAALHARLEAARDCDWWLFTSANAVHTAAAALPMPWPAQIAAVGAATAEALRACGVIDVLMPLTHYSSAALLQLPQLADSAGKRFAIITGEEGRAELAEGLVARGAAVDTVALYRREPVNHARSLVVACVENCHAVVVTSSAGAQRLFDLTPLPLRETLMGKQLLLPSARIGEKVRELGFLVPPLLPEPISDPAIVRILADWWHARGIAP